MPKKLIFFSASLFFLAACDAQTSIHGRVIDKNGIPIPTARVWLVYGSWTSDSDVKSDGTFSISMVHGSSDGLQLVVGAEDHKTYIQPIEAKNRKLENLKIVLESGKPKDLTAKEAP